MRSDRQPRDHPGKAGGVSQTGGDYRRMAREVETIAISGVIPDDSQQ
jgi:hypothetical protein